MNSLISDQSKLGNSVISTNDRYSVALFQRKLNRIMSSEQPLEVDNRMGPKTKEMVVKFQRKYDLTPDGIIGKNTIATIFDKDPWNGKKIEEDPTQYMIHWGEIVLDTVEEMYSTSGCNKSLLFICKLFGLPNEPKNAFRKLAEQAKKDINKIKQTVVKMQDKIKQYDKAISKSNSIQKEKLKLQRKSVYQKRVLYESSQRVKGFSISHNSKSKQLNIYSKKYTIYKSIFNGKTIEGLPKILNGCQKVIGWLRSLGNFMNKIPGLKWGSVVAKLAQGYYELFQGNFKNAFEKFCSSIYGILENAFFDWLYISIGAAVAAAVTSSLLVTIIVLAIIFAITIIYFFIGDKIEEWIQNNIIKSMSEVIY